MGYPAATGPGASLTDATRARDLAPTAFWRRNCSRRSTGMVGLFISARRARRSGGKGRQGGAAGSQKHGAVCADRLAKKRTARAAMFSLAPQHHHQSCAYRRCTNPRTGKSQLSASRGP